MCKTLLICALIVAQVSLGDLNARIQHRRPRLQINQFRSKVTQPSKDEPQRRTFITALLAAEINYLEGLLADQNQSKKPRKPKTKPGKGSNQTKKPHHTPHVHATGQYQSSSKPEKFVSKLDPFYMIAAPDLTKESKISSDYEKPVETPVKTSIKTPEPATPSSPSSTKYGELDHYNLNSYLPPAPSSPVKESSYSPELTYELPPPPSPPAPPVTTYETPSPAPAYEAPVVSYEKPAPPPTYESLAPAPAPVLSYEAPVPAPAYEAPAYSTGEFEYRAPATTYQTPTPVKITPFTAYKPAETVTYEEPKPAPVSSYQSPVPVPAASYQTPEVVKPNAAPAETNQHPLTFFHSSQAEKVHDGGEWPTVYYNTFHGNEKSLIL